ncbi:MAG: hypothetical protein IPN83_16075 [Holophagales bacterium]|nr:hypothetical protein [Holophagales bacterium]
MDTPTHLSLYGGDGREFSPPAAMTNPPAPFAAEQEGEARDEELAREVCRCVGRIAGDLKPEYAQALRKRLVSTCATCAERGCTDYTCGPHGRED